MKKHLRSQKRKMTNLIFLRKSPVWMAILQSWILWKSNYKRNYQPSETSSLVYESLMKVSTERLNYKKKESYRIPFFLLNIYINYYILLWNANTIHATNKTNATIIKIKLLTLSVFIFDFKSLIFSSNFCFSTNASCFSLV